MGTLPEKGWRRPKAEGEPWTGTGLYCLSPGTGLSGSCFSNSTLFCLPRFTELAVTLYNLRGNSILLSLDSGELALDPWFGCLEFGIEARSVGNKLVHLLLLGSSLIPGGFLTLQGGIRLRLKILDLGFNSLQACF
jgi:hypothetical protein